MKNRINTIHYNSATMAVAAIYASAGQDSGADRVGGWLQVSCNSFAVRRIYPLRGCPVTRDQVNLCASRRREKFAKGKLKQDMVVRLEEVLKC